MLFLGQSILFRPKNFFVIPMFNRIYQNFCFLVKRMCRIFLDSSKTIFFPYYPFFSKILESPFTWGP